jgi:hypothetical protein
MNESRVAFSPLKHKIIFAGISISGYAPGTYLEIKPNADLAETIPGSDGELHTNMIANNTGTASLKIFYDNPSYKLLRAAAVAFQTSGTYLPFSSTNISDLLDTTFSAKSNIIRHSTDTYSSSPGDMIRTYDIFLHNVIRV